MAWLWEQWMMPFGQGFPELLVGSPDTLNRRIAEVGARIPLDEVFLLIPQGILEPDKLLHSIDLFARRVLPNFSP
jgi:alkanesulfonate monooxygenase SsuD/methylene tetrahydromethanopterin reductase-like flavin-dependent oxidoreductase (luciferase family)